jgi:hypothetical protein
MLRVLVTTLVLGAGVAHAGLNCRGVFDYDSGKAHFHCRFQGDHVRRARATCRDGQPGCDADGACDGSCRFALCADSACTQTVDVDVPLRNNGRAKRKSVFRTADARVVLWCLPRHGQCPSTGTTGTSFPATTTTTTLPERPCTATLTGAVEATVPCTASLERNILGLRVLRVEFEGPDASGVAAALFIGGATGTHRLGNDMILMVVGVNQPPLGHFQGVHEDSTHHAVAQLDAVDGTEVHGSLDTMLPSTFHPTSLGLHAEF